MTTFKRAFIFDPCMGSMTGHWENLCRRIHDEFQRRGAEVIIFGQSECDDAICHGLNVVPIFTRSPFNAIKSTKDFAEECSYFSQDFLKIDLHHWNFGPGDLLICPTLFPQVFSPLLQWCQNVVGPDRAKAALIFQFPAGEDLLESSATKGPLQTNWLQKILESFGGKKKPMMRWKPSKTIEFYKSILPDLKEKSPENGYYYYGSSSELASNYQALFDTDVHPLPMPAPIHDLPQNNQKDRPLTVGYVGHSALAKGTQFLHEVVTRATKEFQDVEFQLHINPNPDTVDMLKVFDKPMDRVHCRYGHLSQEDLLTMIRDFDIALMPYDPLKYTSTPSAIFTECMTQGKVFVIPNGTWLAGQAHTVRAGYVTYDIYSADGIYRALKYAISHFPDLQKKSQTAKDEFARKHSIKAFVDVLLKSVA
jgi:glycosyltransferase involved in cell wall biosynthesis